MKRTSLAAIVAAGVTLAACGGTDSRAGAVPVGLQGPLGVRAVMFRIVGPIDTVTVPSGKLFHLFSHRGAGDTTIVAVTANTGDVLTGAIAMVHVANTRALPSFQVLQAAASSYALLPDSVYTILVLTSAQ
jgi:hypothetical protein